MQWKPDWGDIAQDLVIGLIFLTMPWILRGLKRVVLRLNGRWTAASLSREIRALEKLQEPYAAIRYLLCQVLACLAIGGAAAMYTLIFTLRDGSRIGSLVWFVAGAAIYWIALRALALAHRKRPYLERVKERLALVEDRIRNLDSGRVARIKNRSEKDG